MPSRHRASGVDSLRAWPHKGRLPHGRRRLPLCQNDEKQRNGDQPTIVFATFAS